MLVVTEAAPRIRSCRGLILLSPPLFGLHLGCHGVRCNLRPVKAAEKYDKENPAGHQAERHTDPQCSEPVSEVGVRPEGKDGGAG